MLDRFNSLWSLIVHFSVHYLFFNVSAYFKYTKRRLENNVYTNEFLIKRTILNSSDPINLYSQKARAGLSEDRAGLSEDRAGLSKDRAGLSEVRAGLSEDRASLFL